MRAGEEPVERIVEEVLAAGRPLTLAQIARAVSLRALRLTHRAAHSPPHPGRRIGLDQIVAVLRAHPDRYVEVAPLAWVRRGDGPEAGVGSRPRRSPFADGAAAAAVPPEPPSVIVDAVAGAGLTAGRRVAQE